MLDSVFHLFSQAARTNRDTRGGLGIGLTVVQGLVHMHEGRITVSSAGAGSGSEFTVYLPRLKRHTAKNRTAERTTRRSSVPKPQQVLVVEDDIDGGATLEALLASDGHRVTVCRDGRSGLVQARTQHPDTVILDIGLPDSNGYEIARLLRSDPSFSDTLFIALTGYGSVEDQRRATEAGFHRHLTKPIDYAMLRSILSKRGKAIGAARKDARAGKVSHSG
jgi:two-component system CheB/CheR fusion protein